jgi:hypothetical protein
LLVAVVAPIATALLLIPGRGHLDTGDNALFLVVAIVAVASTGRRARLRTIPTVDQAFQ